MFSITNKAWNTLTGLGLVPRQVATWLHHGKAIFLRSDRCHADRSHWICWDSRRERAVSLIVSQDAAIVAAAPCQETWLTTHMLRNMAAQSQNLSVWDEALVNSFRDRRLSVRFLVRAGGAHYGVARQLYIAGGTWAWPTLADFLASPEAAAALRGGKFPITRELFLHQVLIRYGKPGGQVAYSSLHLGQIPVESPPPLR